MNSCKVAPSKILVIITDCIFYELTATNFAERTESTALKTTAMWICMRLKNDCKSVSLNCKSKSTLAFTSLFDGHDSITA